MAEELEINNCKHMKFQVAARVHRLVENPDKLDEVKGFALDCRVLCAECKHWFRFVGLEQGVGVGLEMSPGATTEPSENTLFVRIEASKEKLVESRVVAPSAPRIIG